MKIKHLVLILFIPFFTVFNLSFAHSYTSLIKAPAIQADGTKPLTPGPLLDDFSYGNSVNSWNAPTGTFSSSASVPPPADAICTASYITTGAYGGSGYSLRLDYNVTAANSFAGYSSQLASVNMTNPTNYTAVSFYVKGEVGGEFFKIQLKNTGTNTYWDSTEATSYYRNSASVYITDYLDGGVTTGWQKVTIPFHNFANLDGFSSMKEFVIVFENAQCGANGSAKQGIIYIDNITFETAAVTSVRIDHFGDKIGTCALGGNMGDFAGSGDTISRSFSNTTTEYSPYAYGMRLNYTITRFWVGTFIIFGGGATDNTVEKPDKGGWIAVEHDFSSYSSLVFNIRGMSGGNPKVLKIEITDATGTKSISISGITTAWDTRTVALSGFSGLNKKTIKKLTFTLVGNDINNAGGNLSGNLYIDSVQFQ